MDDKTKGTPPGGAGDEKPDTDGDTPTVVTPPPAGGDAAETVAQPPADEGATAVLSGDTAAKTQVMGAAGGGAGAPPPPRRPTPTLMMERPPRKGGSNTLWIVIIVLVLLAAAALGVWYFALRTTSSPSPTPSATPVAAWAGTWGASDGSGGGLVIHTSGSTAQVTAYDAALQVIGVATATAQGASLRFSLDTQARLDGAAGPLDVVLTFGSTTNTATMKVTGANQTTVIIPLVRVGALVPISPSPSASPSPSGSPTGSPSPTPSSSASPDQQVINGVIKIQIGVITWATNNNNLYPLPSDVSQSGGVAQYVNPWPTNPYTKQPMQAGTNTGDYTYEQLNGGQGYKLTGYLSNGLTYTLP